MKNQRKNHSTLKVMLLSCYLTVFLSHSLTSAQETESQQSAQVEESTAALNQAFFADDLIIIQRVAARRGMRRRGVGRSIAEIADVNAVDEYGRAPLHIAASAGDINAVELLCIFICNLPFVTCPLII